MRNSSSGTGLLAIIGVAIMIIAYAVKFILIAVSAGAALFGLYYVIKLICVGHVKSKYADPLFTKAAKKSIRVKRLTQKDVCEWYSIDQVRGSVILEQLRLASVINGNNACLKNSWELIPIFREINRTEHYFTNKLNQEIAQAQSDLEKQIENESNEFVKSLMRYYGEKHIREDLLSYLKNSLTSSKAYASQDVLNSLEQDILSFYRTEQNNSMDITVKDNLMTLFNIFSSSLSNLGSQPAIWNSSHKKITITNKSFSDIHINGEILEVPCIMNDGREYYFYPSFVLIFDNHSAEKPIKVSEYRKIVVSRKQRVETGASWFSPQQADFAYKTWAHTCKDGSPNLRYKYNPQISFYNFTELTISGVGLTLLFGKLAHADSLSNAFNVYLSSI